jgi:hypothetical protein
MKLLMFCGAVALITCASSSVDGSFSEVREELARVNEITTTAVRLSHKIPSGVNLLVTFPNMTLTTESTSCFPFASGGGPVVYVSDFTVGTDVSPAYLQTRQWRDSYDLDVNKNLTVRSQFNAYNGPGPWGHSRVCSATFNVGFGKTVLVGLTTNPWTSDCEIAVDPKDKSVFNVYRSITNTGTCD